MKIIREDFKEYHPVFQYPFLRGEEFAKQYIKRFSKNKHIFKMMYSFFYTLNTSFSKSKCEILFFGSKFADLIVSLKDKGCSVGIIGGYKELLLAKHLKIPFYFIYPWKFILSELYNDDPGLKSRKAANIIKSLGNFLEDLQAKIIILPNDSLFLERFLIFSAKDVGIKTICIQHGLFSDRSNGNIMDGYFSDYMFLWGNSQKKLYEKLYSQHILDKKFKILGYPFFTINNFNDRSNEKNICILGQPFELYDFKLGKRKIKIFERIAYLFKREGYDVYYKPHPGERSKNFFPRNVKFYKKNLKSAFKEFGIFISLTSTALLEASLNKRIAIQIYDPLFNPDDFQEKGYSYMIKIENLEKIVEFTKRIKESFCIHNFTIYRPNDIAQQFLHVLMECGIKIESCAR